MATSSDEKVIFDPATYVPPEKGEKRNWAVGTVESHFLDSGSFTLWRKAKEYNKETRKGPWAFYDTPEFYAYMDAYAEFIKANLAGVDLYANVDVIPNAKLSWRNLKYLEDLGIRPVPVVHVGTDVKWIQRHIEAGYEFLGLGGMVANGGYGARDADGWLDRAFDVICDQPSRMPKIKVHGFGVFGPTMFRYPFWSTDTAGWCKAGGFGKCYVPYKRKGKFVFNDPSGILLPVSDLASERSQKGKHLFTLSKAERKIMFEWFDSIGIPIGKTDKSGNIITPGIRNDHILRRAANVLYYNASAESVPEWPWPFSSGRREGFGLT